MITPLKLRLKESLGNKRFSDRFLSTLAKDEVAGQIRALRLKRGLKTQAQFAKALGMQQSAVSRLEMADYSGWTFKTLLRIALKLKARLRISFEPLENVVAKHERNEQSAITGERTIYLDASMLRTLCRIFVDTTVIRGSGTAPLTEVADSFVVPPHLEAAASFDSTDSRSEIREIIH